MTAPCEQKDNIGNIAKTLERMEDGQKAIVRLLEKSANQDARIDHLEEDSEDHHNNIESVLERMRALELKDAANGPEAQLKLQVVMEEFSRKIDDINLRIEKILRFYKITTGRYAIYVYSGIAGMILLGFASDIRFHGEWIKAIWKFWKG